MVTIPLKVSDELAQRLMPLQDRLPDIIERGLRDLEAETGAQSATASKAAVLEALQATGIVTVPDPKALLQTTPINIHRFDHSSPTHPSTLPSV